jgi:hypothetical protein
VKRRVFKDQFIDRAGELERRLIAMIDSRASVESNVEGFINGPHQWDGVFDGFLSQFLTIHREHAGTTLAGTGALIFVCPHVPIRYKRSILSGLLLIHLFQFLFQQRLLLLLAQLGKQQYKLESKAPRRSSRRMHSVSIELRGDVHRLES